MTTIAHINVSSKWSIFQVWCCIQNQIEESKDDNINEYNTTYGNDVALTEEFLIRIYHLIEKVDKVYIYNSDRMVDVEDQMLFNNVTAFCESRKIPYSMEKLNMVNYV